VTLSSDWYLIQVGLLLELWGQVALGAMKIGVGEEAFFEEADCVKR